MGWDGLKWVEDGVEMRMVNGDVVFVPLRMHTGVCVLLGWLLLLLLLESRKKRWGKQELAGWVG